MSKPKPPESQSKHIDADQLIRDYYEGEDAIQQGAYPEDTLAPVPHIGKAGTPDAGLTGGDVDAAPSGTDGGEETVGGSAPTPDQDVVDEVGKALGITYEDTEPLKIGDKLADRDARRWELNPASSEDYQDRLRDLSTETPTAPKSDKKPAEAKRSKRTGDSKPRTTSRTRKTSKTKR